MAYYSGNLVYNDWNGKKTRWFSGNHAVRVDTSGIGVSFLPAIDLVLQPLFFLILKTACNVMLISSEYNSHQVRQVMYYKLTWYYIHTVFMIFVNLKTGCETNPDNIRRKDTWIPALINRQRSEDFRKTQKCEELGVLKGNPISF